MKKTLIILFISTLFFACEKETNSPIEEEELLPSINYNGVKLYVHPTDNSNGIQWYNGEFIEIGAYDYQNGKNNIPAIIEEQGQGDYAACLCDKLVAFGYSDWYLPSREELSTIYYNRESIGNFNTEYYSNYYWSSSEKTDAFAPGYGAFVINFGGDVSGASYGFSKSQLHQVRCVRRD